MLLYSTVLDVKELMTEQSFIQLLIDANQDHDTYTQNIIPLEEIKWDGKKTNNTFGNENLSLKTIKFKEGNILAARFEKRSPSGKVWETDYVWDIPEKKISIRLDRSYSGDTLISDEGFYAPSFIKYLIREGFLEDDRNLPISTEPVMICEDNINLLHDVMNYSVDYRLPVVYISKTFKNEDPVDPAKLAEKVRGIAHVFVESDQSLDFDIRAEAADKDTYDGVVSIYFPNRAFPQKRLNRRHELDDKNDESVELIRNEILNYMNSREIPFIYTWEGVNASISDSDINDLLVGQNTAADELKQKNAELNNKLREYFTENENLRSQNNLLKYASNKTAAGLTLSLGEEQEFFSDEAKEIVLEALKQTLQQFDNQKRRHDVLQSIVDGNECPDALIKKGDRVAELLKAYHGMDSRLENELKALGLSCVRKEKHNVFQYYDDPRYTATLASTPGSQKSGKNTVDDIKRTMF